MTDLSNLEQLRARVMEAKGGDWEIDVEIAVAFPPLGETRKILNGPYGKYWYENESAAGSKLADKVSFSIDEAVAFINRVLPGWRHGSGNGDGKPWAYLVLEGFDGHEVEATTQTLALLAAALSALIVKEKAGE